MNKSDTAGVIARPPLVYLTALVIGLVASTLVPTPFPPRALGYPLGAVLVVIALGLFGSGIRTMGRAGTPVRTSDPTTALVTTGPFRFTRNPVYLSFTLCYAGIALAARSLWALLLLPVVLVVIQYGVIYREERYLERRFGVDYVQYRERVRRWI